MFNEGCNEGIAGYTECLYWITGIRMLRMLVACPVVNDTNYNGLIFLKNLFLYLINYSRKERSTPFFVKTASSFPIARTKTIAKIMKIKLAG